MSDGRFALLEAPQTFAVSARPTPVPGPGEVLLRVKDCGVCGSDLKMWAGTHAFLRPPLVLGHEVYGTVESAGRGSSIAPGTQAVVFPPVGCGACFHCERGQEQLCADMTFYGGQIPGGLAEHVVVAEANLIEIPAGVPDDLRVLIEPLAVGVHAVARAAVEPGESAVVIGAGAIGLFTALVARERGLERLLVAEPSETRRRRAAACDLTTVDPAVLPLRDAVAEYIRPEGADVVFECVGSQATIAAALSATRKGGRAVVVGNAPPTLELDGLELQRGDRSLVGVLMYERADFVTAMELLAGGLLDCLPPESLVEWFTLDEAGAAFAASKLGTLSGLRAVVRP